MTQMKFSYQLGQAAAEAVSEIVDHVYATKGSTFMAVVEFVRKKTLEEEDPDKENTVWVGVGALAIGAGEQANLLREVQRALYLQRTARGTLDQANELRLAKQTLKDAQGLVSGEEVARLSAWIRLIRDELAAVTADETLDARALRKAADAVVDRASAALRGTQIELAGATP